MAKYRYIIITEDFEVSGTDNRDDALALADDCVVLEIADNGETNQLDAAGDHLDIVEA